MIYSDCSNNNLTGPNQMVCICVATHSNMLQRLVFPTPAEVQSLHPMTKGGRKERFSIFSHVTEESLDLKGQQVRNICRGSSPNIIVNLNENTVLLGGM